MTEGKCPRGPALLCWGDLCHSSVWGFTGFKLELELRGRTLSKVTDYYRAEAKHYLPDRGKNYEAEPRQ